MESRPIPIHRRIFLVGFMGAGKTTVGRSLAERLSWQFADLDEIIESELNRSIKSIFEAEGEDAFRRYEHETLENLLHAPPDQPCVVALGGGTIAQSDNQPLLAEANGVTVWLFCPLEELLRRCAGMTHRPLFRDEEQFRQLYASRLPYYEKADFRVDSSPRNPKAVAEEIVQCLPF